MCSMVRISQEMFLSAPVVFSGVYRVECSISLTLSSLSAFFHCFGGHFFP